MPSVDTVRRAARMPGLYGNFLTAFRNRARPYFDSDEQVVYRLRNGAELIAAPGPHDVKIINEIWLDGQYAAPGFTPRPGWTVVDLGANKGFYASWVLTQAPGARVVCYEPDPRNFDALTTTTAPFSGSVTLHQAAVGPEAAQLTLYRLAGRPGQASLSESRAVSRGTIVAAVTVDVHPLAEVLADPVDLLKVDVEGAEYAILCDSPAHTLEKVARIAVEVDPFDPNNPDRRPGDLFAHLTGCGFAQSGRRGTVHFFERA